MLSRKIIKKLKKHNPNKKNLVIVIGGDGFMLKTLKKNISNTKLFYGINSGNYGFLMNKFSKKNLYDYIIKIKPVQIHPLVMSVERKNGYKKMYYKLNVIVRLLNTNQVNITFY